MASPAVCAAHPGWKRIFFRPSDRTFRRAEGMMQRRIKIKLHTLLPIPCSILPAMQLEYSGGDSKAKPGPLCPLSSDTVKLIPDPGQLLFPDAFSLVIHPETQIFLFLIQCHADDSSRAHMLSGISDKIVQNLFHFAFIRPYLVFFCGQTVFQHKFL